MPSIRRHRGFTLVELMTALGIATVLMGISILALRGLKDRSTFSGATSDMLTALRECRALAYGSGASTVFVVDTAGGRWWSLNDPKSNFDISLKLFDPANPAPTGGSVIDSNTLPASVSFTGAANGYGAALPQPFAGVPSFSGSSITPSLNYCSFCNKTAPNAGFGAIKFMATRSAQFGGSPTNGIGESMTLQGTLAQAGNNFTTIAIIAKTATMSSFSGYR